MGRLYKLDKLDKLDNLAPSAVSVSNLSCLTLLISIVMSGTSAFAMQYTTQTTPLTQQQALAAGLGNGASSSSLMVTNPDLDDSSGGGLNGNTPPPTPTPDPCADPSPSPTSTSHDPDDDGWWKPNNTGNTYVMTGGPIIAGGGISTTNSNTNNNGNCNRGNGNSNSGSKPNPTGGTTTNPPVNTTNPPIAPISTNSSLNPVTQVMTDVNGGITILSNIVNLANGVWNLLARGKPSETINSGSVAVVPSNFDPKSNWSALHCPEPITQNFNTCIVNDSGAPVECFNWGLKLTGDCSIGGVGSYIGGLQFVPNSFNGGYGSNLTVDATFPQVYNAGSDADPVGAAILNLKLQDNGLFTVREASYEIVVTGSADNVDPTIAGVDKHFREASKSSNGGAPVSMSPY